VQVVAFPKVSNPVEATPFTVVAALQLIQALLYKT
jgi:hypothetical protein